MAASNSLEAITSICRDHIKSHFDVLLQVVSALVTLPIPTETAVRVVKGVTKVCSRLPDHQLPDALHQLCKIHVDELTRISQVILTFLSCSEIVFYARRIFSFVCRRKAKPKLLPKLAVIQYIGWIV